MGNNLYRYAGGMVLCDAEGGAKSQTCCGDRTHHVSASKHRLSCGLTAAIPIVQRCTLSRDFEAPCIRPPSPALPPTRIGMNGGGGEGGGEGGGGDGAMSVTGTMRGCSTPATSIPSAVVASETLS